MEEEFGIGDKKGPVKVVWACEAESGSGGIPKWLPSYSEGEGGDGGAVEADCGYGEASNVKGVVG